MDASPAGQIMPSQGERERLAKDWLLELIERTPLSEVGGLPVSWVAAEAPGLIAAIVDALGAEDPAQIPALDRELTASMAQLRSGPGAAEQIPRDLAALQSLFVDRLGRELSERASGELALAAGRLAEIFGSIQGATAGELASPAAAALGQDPITGLPGPAELDRWLRELLAEQRLFGHVFSLALVDVDGLDRINDAYGRDAGDRALAAVAATLRQQLREVDHAFRLEEDEFAVVAPHTDGAALEPMARRVAELIASSQSPDGPRTAVAAGIVDCPGDGLSAERLLESAAEATYAAKASGAAVARSPAGSNPPLQDP